MIIFPCMQIFNWISFAFFLACLFFSFENTLLLVLIWLDWSTFLFWVDFFFFFCVFLDALVSESMKTWCFFHKEKINQIIISLCRELTHVTRGEVLGDVGLFSLQLIFQWQVAFVLSMLLDYVAFLCDYFSSLFLEFNLFLLKKTLLYFF